MAARLLFEPGRVAQALMAERPCGGNSQAHGGGRRSGGAILGYVDCALSGSSDCRRGEPDVGYLNLRGLGKDEAMMASLMRRTEICTSAPIL